MAVLPRPSGVPERESRRPIRAHRYDGVRPPSAPRHWARHAEVHAAPGRLHGADPQGILHLVAHLHHRVRDRHQRVHI